MLQVGAGSNEEITGFSSLLVTEEYKQKAFSYYFSVKQDADSALNSAAVSKNHYVRPSFNP